MADAQAQEYKNAKLREEAAVAQPMTIAELKAKQEEAPHMHAQTGLLGEQTKWFGPTARADINYKNIEGEYKKARIDPFNDPEHMPDLLKAESYYINFKNKYGENHPITKEALNNYRMLQKQVSANAAWHDLLGQSMGYRALTPIAKDQLSQQQAEAGFQPSALQNVPVGRIGDQPQQNTFQSATSPTMDLNRPFGQDIPTTLGGATQPQPAPQPMPQPAPQPTQQPIPTLGQAMANQSYPGQAPIPSLSAPQQPAQQPAQLTSNRAIQMAEQFKDKIEKDTSTTQILNQRQYAGVLHGLFEVGDTLVNDVSKYAGLAGKGKNANDWVKSAFGKTSPEYQNYLYFTRSLLPFMANEVKRTLGGQSTDQESEAMTNLSNPVYIDSNPEQAVAQYKFLKMIVQTKIGPSIAKGLSQARADLTSPEQSNTVSNKGEPGKEVATPSAADIAHTAKKYGVSEDEVKRRLGIK
jgi:hypothetical protein